MSRLPRLIALAAVLLTAPSLAGAATTALQLQGKGVQIYACQAAGAGIAWTLKGPEAILLDQSGAQVGRHFVGPSWQASDGSTIVGEPLVASPSPTKGSVAWLVLHIKSSSGAGLFANIAYVARTATSGGAAPATGCDAGHVGAEARIAYTATYTFFPQAAPPPH